MILVRVQGFKGILQLWIRGNLTNFVNNWRRILIFLTDGESHW